MYHPQLSVTGVSILYKTRPGRAKMKREKAIFRQFSRQLLPHVYIIKKYLQSLDRKGID
jgi:hypothetical protein